MHRHLIEHEMRTLDFVQMFSETRLLLRTGQQHFSDSNIDRQLHLHVPSDSHY